jgi:hypothetical protein
VGFEERRMAKLNGPAPLSHAMGEAAAACMTRRRVHCVIFDSSGIVCLRLGGEAQNKSRQDAKTREGLNLIGNNVGRAVAARQITVGLLIAHETLRVGIERQLSLQSMRNIGQMAEYRRAMPFLDVSVEIR